MNGSEIDWDSPDEDVINFEELELEKDTGSPFKKEPIVKPKTGGFNINFRDLEDVVSALTAAEMQLQNNLVELKKLDGIAQKAEVLSQISTESILSKMDGLNYTQIARKITGDIREELQKTRLEILKSADEATAAAKDLAAKTELLKESSDSLLQIDNMAENLEEVAKDIKKWRIKSMYAAIALSLFFGIAAGTIASNIGSLFIPSQTIQNADILTPKFGKIAVLSHDTNPNVFYFAFGAKELKKEVQTLEKDGVRYIMIQSQK